MKINVSPEPVVYGRMFRMQKSREMNPLEIFSTLIYKLP